MGSGASVATHLGIGMEDTCTSLGSSITAPMGSEVSTCVPVSDWSILEYPHYVTEEEFKRIEALNLRLSRASRIWMRSVT